MLKCVRGLTSYEKCKPMDSKMKPLWLVWRNMELAAGTKEFESFLMFKKGDGTCCECYFIFTFSYWFYFIQTCYTDSFSGRVVQLASYEIPLIFNNNNNNQDNIYYGAVIMLQALQEFTRFIW